MTWSDIWTRHSDPVLSQHSPPPPATHRGREDRDMNMFDTGTSVYSLPFRDQGVKEDPGSDGAADTTSDSDTALNLASGNKHG